MSKNKYYAAKRLKDCKNIMTISNLSQHQFKVTLQRVDGSPLEYGDFQIAIKGGEWNVTIDASEPWVEAIIEGDK